MKFWNKFLLRPLILTGMLVGSFAHAEHYYDYDSSACCVNNTSTYHPTGWNNCFSHLFKNWYVDGEWIYCRTCEDGLPVAITQGSPLTCCNSNSVGSTIHDMHFTWESSFRIGFGAELACYDCWDISVYWTHFYGRGHRDVLPSISEPLLFPAFGGATLTIAANNAENASARWRLNVDLVDIDFGRYVSITPCLSIKPYLGVRIGRIDQKFKLHSISAAVATTGTAMAADPQRKVQLKSLFEGAGVHFGVGGDLGLGCGFSLYADGALSLLYGSFHLHADEEAMMSNALTPISKGFAQSGAQRQAVSTSLFQFETSDKFCKCQGIADAAVGIKWHGCVCNNRLTLKLGWEQHLFWNQNRFDDVVLTNTVAANRAFAIGNGVARANNGTIQQTRGDLCVHGVVFGGELEF